MVNGDAFYFLCHNIAPITHASCDLRSVVASSAIRTGEVVVEVPDDAVLMGESCGISDQLGGE